MLLGLRALEVTVRQDLELPTCRSTASKGTRLGNGKFLVCLEDKQEVMRWGPHQKALGQHSTQGVGAIH